jgi:glucose/arabinose dehydrogenase
MLVSERPGRLRIVAPDGRLSDPAARPAARGRRRASAGCWTCCRTRPSRTTRCIYWSYAEAGEGGNSTAVARGRLDGDQKLVDVKVIFRQLPKVASSAALRRSLVFDARRPAVRDPGRPLQPQGRRAELCDNHLGKIVRIDADGARAGRQPVRRPARLRPTPGPRSGAWATATCRARHCTPTAAICGPASMARRAATRSTAC